MQPKDLNYRYKGLDTVRVFAMLVGIPFHVSLAYGVFDLSWIESNYPGHIAMDYFSYWIRVFRMPLFFLISGFFAHLSFLKRENTFLKERIKRIFIPFIVFASLLLPVMRAIYLCSKKLELIDSHKYYKLLQFIINNFFSFKHDASFSSGINYAHLWFLMYLTVFSILAFAMKKIIFNREYNKFGLFLFPVFTSLSLLTMNSSWIDDPFVWYPRISLIFYYGIFFFAGIQLYSFRDRLIKNLSVPLSLKLTFIFFTVFVTAFRIQVQIDSPMQQNSIILSAWMSLSTWMLILCSICLGNLIQHKFKKFVHYFSKSSYFLYIIHMPIVLVCQLLLNSININWLYKFMLCTLFTFFLSILIYELFVKDKSVQRFLKGQY